MTQKFKTLICYYCIEQSSSWETNRFLGSQEIPHILWNPKVHCHIHKCLPPVPILNQLDSVHTPTFQLLKIHLNIILPSMPGSPQWSLSLWFPHQNPVYVSPILHMCYMPNPSHFLWSPNDIWYLYFVLFWQSRDCPYRICASMTNC